MKYECYFYWNWYTKCFQTHSDDAFYPNIILCDSFDPIPFARDYELQNENIVYYYEGIKTELTKELIQLLCNYEENIVKYGNKRYVFDMTIQQNIHLRKYFPKYFQKRIQFRLDNLLFF